MKYETKDTVSKVTVLRLPSYLRYLQMAKSKNVEYVSSSEMAADMSLSAVAVRKDLAIISSVPGKPRIGFAVKRLISDIERFLGYHRVTRAVVVGAGRLGRALLAYEGYENYGISVVAAFDTMQVGAMMGKPIYPMERLPEIVKREDVKVGILTVPKQFAQEACDKMIDAGITSIQCFVPAHLNVPDGVHIQYEDMAASLANLCGELIMSK